MKPIKYFCFEIVWQVDYQIKMINLAIKYAKTDKSKNIYKKELLRFKKIKEQLLKHKQSKEFITDEINSKRYILSEKFQNEIKGSN